MLPNFNVKGALLVKQRILSGAVIILFAAAIVLFNESFPMGLNIAIALIGHSEKTVSGVAQFDSGGAHSVCFVFAV